MLTLRKKPTAPEKVPDAVDLLLECHDRIRRFTRMGAWLSHAHDAPPKAIEETAEAVLRYFTEALPRHSADEDESIAPRLLAAGISDDLRVAVEMMSRQHPALEEVLGRLAPGWRAVAEDHRALPEHVELLTRATEQLGGMWAVHLNLEENSVFPAIRAHLGPAALVEVAAEMRARRR